MAYTIDGRYTVIRQLGEGGMGAVYLAEDERLGRSVAIKRLRVMGASPAMLEQFMARFQREARAMARMQHLHIIRILDYGTDADGAYLVMEYLPNGTLKDRMDGAMPLAQAVGYLLPITEALTYLHERSLIHRDIKPANILFDENDHPMLADFGIIKLMEGGDGATLTATGASVGTPAYMAPELIGGEASAQTDQYALGVVLFELLTGKKPFEGRTPMETLTMQKYEPLPDPRRFKADLPEGVCEFLKRALAKPPEARYPSMAEFRAALVGLTESKPEPAPVAVVVNEDATQLEAGEEDETFNAVLKTSRTTLAEPRFQRLPKDAEARSSASERQGKALGTLKWLFFAMIGWIVLSVVVGLLVKHFRPEVGSMQLREADGMVMVYVPGSAFTMGREEGDSDEKPVREVGLAAYWIDQYEVTNGQYEKCVNAGACTQPKYTSSYTQDDYYGRMEYNDYPVIRVDWNQAQAYCKWVGGSLPTEAQWEKAARGIDGRAYPWGEASPTCGLANYYGCVGDTSKVGSYAGGASPYGAMDMAGNVWEWVLDWYDSGYYEESPLVNPTGPTSGTYRVFRGGSWNDSSSYLRSTDRRWFSPDSDWTHLGFRCAFSP